MFVPCYKVDKKAKVSFPYQLKGKDALTPTFKLEPTQKITKEEGIEEVFRFGGGTKF